MESAINAGKTNTPRDEIVVPRRGGGIRRWLVRALARPARHMPYFRKVAKAAEYLRLRDTFVKNGRRSPVGVDQRRNMVRAFERIDGSVPIASEPAEGIMLAEFVLSLECDGPIVECGCFSGGSTAKLSIAAEAVDREVLVFDSFEGLPDSDEHASLDYNARYTAKESPEWKQGQYHGRLETVQRNVGAFGDVGRCRFIKGWFSDTLTQANLPARIGMAFTDVDLATSARDCLTRLWPLLGEGGVYASHDIPFIKVLQVFYDRAIWTDELKDFPPILFGAGYGLGDAAPFLGFAVKGKNVSADYIKRLMLVK